MTKNIVGGIELSDDMPVTEYDGKFSGTFELDPESGKAMGYDDVVYFVVTARVDSYGYKATKWGDLKRVNTLKVDNVRLVNAADLNKLHHVAPTVVVQPELVEADEEDFEVDGAFYEMGDPTLPEPTPAPKPVYPDEDEEEIFVPEPRPTPQRPAVDKWVSQDMPNNGRQYKDPILANFLNGH